MAKLSDAVKLTSQLLFSTFTCF